jgi:hypothetical protein
MSFRLTIIPFSLAEFARTPVWNSAAPPYKTDVLLDSSSSQGCPQQINFHVARLNHCARVAAKALKVFGACHLCHPPLLTPHRIPINRQLNSGVIAIAGSKIETNIPRVAETLCGKLFAVGRMRTIAVNHDLGWVEVSV